MLVSKMPKKVEKPNVKNGCANNGGAREGAGRPEFVPTDEERKQVEALSGYGLPQEQIAILVRTGIHLDTLKVHFRTELDSGKAKANAKIGQTLFQQAMSGNTTAAIFWAKTQMRWREPQEIDHKSSDGSMSPKRSLTPEEVEAEMIARGLPLSLLKE